MNLRGLIVTVFLCGAVVFVALNLPDSRQPMEGRETCKESICAKEMLVACRDGVASWEFEISRQDHARLGPQQQWGYFRKLTVVGSSDRPAESVVHGFGPAALPEKFAFSQGKRIIEFGMTSESTISYDLDADLVCGRKKPAVIG